MQSTTTSKALLTAALICVVTSTAQAVASAASWQEKQLLRPTSAQLAAEATGRVVIYDQLHEGLVDRAIETQFARVENMMFVRTRHTEPDGVVWEDDDCD
jgi:hypothetical protein